MKNKLISTLLIFSCFCNPTVFASDAQKEQHETEVLEGIQEDTPDQEISFTEVLPTRTQKETNLQNWLFAAGSIVSATVAILVVGWSQGAAPSSH